MVDDPIKAAVHQLRRLPTIGEKSATRLVYWLLRNAGVAKDVAEVLHLLEEGIRECEVCFNFTGNSPCAICRGLRDDHVLCVVEEPQDVLAFERGGEFQGRYHVLHGALSPLDGVTPSQLRIRPLLERLRQTDIQEVILATNPTIEGDTTALYLARLLKELDVRVTRLAHGLSVGTEIEYANAISLARALQNRSEL
jgi:recombination protein RecR